MNMRRILPILLAAVLLLGLCSSTQAQESGRLCQLSITVGNSETKVPRSGITIAVYKIGDLDPTSPQGWTVYSLYDGIDILGATTSREIDAASEAVSKVIAARGIQCLKKGTTDENGQVSFTGLEPGIYYGEWVSGPKELLVQTFLVNVPSWEDGKLKYTVEMEPKYVVLTPEPGAEPTPTAAPTEEPTEKPTQAPTPEPTPEPTAEPTEEPTAEPTAEPTPEPTAEPTEEPTAEPTPEPTAEPTEEPTAEPTVEPTPEPTQEPTEEPTQAPTATPKPTPKPGGGPGKKPTKEPTATPIPIHTVTVRYWVGEEPAFPTRTYQHYEGEEYNIVSPVKPGYRVDVERVQGVMGDHDVVYDVYYVAEEYHLTVKYIYEDGATAAPTHRQTLPAGADYDVPSPVIPGYVPTMERVVGVMPGRDVEYTVIYTPSPAPGSGSHVINIDEYETPLGLGHIIMHTGVCYE